MGEAATQIRCRTFTCVILIVLCASGLVASSCPEVTGFSKPVRDDPSRGYTWGVPSNGFGNYLTQWGGFHPGEDWSVIGKPGVALGEPVYPAATGTVAKISDLGTLGHLVAIRHTGTFSIPASHGSSSGQSYSYAAESVGVLYTLYLHISSVPVHEGDCVFPGSTVLGYIIDPGAGPHVHFELRDASASPSNNWSLVLPSGNWAADSSGYTGYYLNLQQMANVGLKRPSDLLGTGTSAPPVSVSNFFQKNSNGQYTITCPSDNLVDASFQLINNSSSSIVLSQVAMSLHRDSDDSFVADVAIQSNVTIVGGGTYQFPRSFLDGNNPNLVPDTYRLVAKIYYAGAWIELALHLPFTILSRFNNCGTQSSPEIASLTAIPQQASWVYYQSNSTAQWYISASNGETYLLSGAGGNSGELAWGEIANGNPVSTVDYLARTVYVSPSASVQTSGTSYPGVTIAGGRIINILSSRGYTSAQQVAGQTMPHAWYFFQVLSTGIWYIVNSNGTTTDVYRLRLNSDNSDYNWLLISNSSWKRSFSGTGSSMTIILSER